MQAAKEDFKFKLVTNMEIGIEIEEVVGRRGSGRFRFYKAIDAQMKLPCVGYVEDGPFRIDGDADDPTHVRLCQVEPGAHSDTHHVIYVEELYPSQEQIDAKVNWVHIIVGIDRRMRTQVRVGWCDSAGKEDDELEDGPWQEVFATPGCDTKARSSSSEDTCHRELVTRVLILSRASSASCM